MELHMRESRVLRKLRAGEVATSIKLNMGDPRVVEMAAMCGFDCIWLDLEHVPNDMSGIENMIRAAKMYDADVLTRVSKGCYSDFIRPLEADSSGIMVPHLMSLKEAKEIVYYTKFHPVGRRPIDGGNADGKFCAVNAADYIREANEQRFVVVQIEDPEPLAELEEICALPGLDMIFFGPADFAQGAGVPCDMGNEIVLETRKRVAECARRHGKFAGTVGGVQNQDMLIDMGYQFINLGSDVRALYSYFSNITEQCSGKKAK
ncbi:MAG: aldolase [Clostridia bacterium]|nr:aldolase [Clostridia bacterium]